MPRTKARNADAENSNRPQAAYGDRGFPCKRKNVHFCYACALTARGGEGLGPAVGGAFSKRKGDFDPGRAEPAAQKRKSSL